MAEKLILSNMTLEYDDFMRQFNNSLKGKDVWRGELVTTTSQTILGFISTVGVHTQETIRRAREDAFSDTAQSDEAIRSIAQMQGLRMSRKYPASLEEVVFESDTSLSLAPYTQMSVGGQPYFSREQITFEAGVPKTVTLFQGTVRFVELGKTDGSEHQQYISEEDGYVVSDRDTNVKINGETLGRSYGMLWNYRDTPAFADLTLPDGRLLIQFGTNTFGSVPQRNDYVLLSYVLTEGAAGNARMLKGKSVTVNGFSGIRGVSNSNPGGGADEKPVIVYKNVASGSFGTYESAVTRAHYLASVTSYPGVLDAITLAQREINPNDLNLMNTIRIAALTNTPWTQSQIRDYLKHLQEVTMYAPYFIWLETTPIDRDVDMTVYVFNSVIQSQVKENTERAVTELFAPKPGLLMTDFHPSDLDTIAKKASPGKVSYVEIHSPTGPMEVKAPPAAIADYDIVPGGGNMDQGVYGYSVAVTNSLEEGFPDRWTFPQIRSGDDNGISLRWRSVPGALSYRIYGRRSEQGFGLLATIQADETQEFMTFFDNGATAPTGGVPSTVSSVQIRYNRLRSLRVRVEFADRQQQVDGTPQRIRR